MLGPAISDRAVGIGALGTDTGATGTMVGGAEETGGGTGEAGVGGSPMCSAIGDKSPPGLSSAGSSCLIPEGEDGRLEA